MCWESGPAGEGMEGPGLPQCISSIWLILSSVLLWQTGNLVQLERRRKRRDYVTKNRNETGNITENVWVDPHKQFQSCVFLQ